MKRQARGTMILNNPMQKLSSNLYPTLKGVN